MKNLRIDILEMFLDAQLLVFDAARARFQHWCGLRGGFGPSSAYRARHVKQGKCINCPREARPNRTKCEPCAIKAYTYQPKKMRFAEYQAIK